MVNKVKSKNSPQAQVVQLIVEIFSEAFSGN
jgi:hypothetical protein